MKQRTLFHSSVHRCQSLAAAVIAVAVCGPVTVRAAAANEAAATIDPRADELIKRMADHLARAKFFSVNAEIWQDIQLGSGQQIQAGRTLKLQVRRPNRFRAQMQSPRRNRELIYDGSTITMLNKAQNFYGAIKAPGSLDQALDVASDKFGIAMPLDDFVSSDPYRDLLEKVRSGTYIGPVTVMGVPCEHLAFSQNNIDWQLWIEKDRPIPRKFVITYKDESDSPEFTAIFSDWDFKTDLPDSLFKFRPPAGATKIAVKELREENQSHQTEKQSK